MTIYGPTTTGKATIYFPGNSITTRVLRFKNVRFSTADIMFYIGSTAGYASVDIDGTDIDRTAVVSTVFKIVGGTASQLFVKVSNIKWEHDNVGSFQNIFDVSGSNTELIINGMSVICATPGTCTCISAYNGCNIRIQSFYIDTFNTTISVPNIGTGPNFMNYYRRSDRFL